jgi:hypothetical protein
MFKKQDNGKITVANVTLAQLSRGLYRSNATVFKELINNAYDADASVVRIDTNCPEFDYISCVDNGKGMSLENFVKHFSEQGIGISTKRSGSVELTETYKRPLIGRLGIGLTAIGQLCHSFNIESHYIDNKGYKKAYRAEIILTDDLIPTIEESIRKPNFIGKKIEVGEWYYEIIDYEPYKQGVRLYSSDVRGTFRRAMKQSFENAQDYKMIPFSLNLLCDRFYQQKSIKVGKPYFETIWELSTLCPLPYLENQLSPIHFSKNRLLTVNDLRVLHFLAQRNQSLRDYHFKLFFDGIELKRLIQLPTDPNTTPLIYFVDFDQIIFETQLKFSGYLFVQKPTAIKPIELNGIQIRLRNIGIGGYSFLRSYRQVDTEQSQWITGEIFVDEGLETALNIDRDSFNEHEEHYQALQNYLHDYLDQIFDDIRTVA